MQTDIPKVSTLDYYCRNMKSITKSHNHCLMIYYKPFSLDNGKVDFLTNSNAKGNKFGEGGGGHLQYHYKDTCKIHLVFHQIVGTIINVFKHHHHSCCLVANVNEKSAQFGELVVCGYGRTTQLIKSVKNLWALQNCSSLYLQ